MLPGVVQVTHWREKRLRVPGRWRERVGDSGVHCKKMNIKLGTAILRGLSSRKLEIGVVQGLRLPLQTFRGPG